MLRRFSIRRRRPSVKTFNVLALDGAILSFNLDSRSIGRELLDRVLQESGINSADRLRFNLATQEESYLKWILLHKPLKKQLSGHSPYTLLFKVYIYPYDHHSLAQSLTRHYLYLQIKQDMKQNRLQPSSPSAVTHITSLVVQGEVGNYIPHTCSNGYVKELHILPAMTSGMEEAIKQAHRLNRGRLPGECEEEVLDLVQEEPTYGSVYYSIQDSHRQPLTVCVCPVGVRVAQGGRQVNCFKWESITKTTSRGKHVYLHIDASQTLTAYQVHYICLNSAVAVNLAFWCQTLVNYYCSVDLEEEGSPPSKLRRFFSTRRSLRHSSGRKRQAAAYPGSIPVQRRSRRASVGGDTTVSIPGTQSQAKKTLAKSDSKLVIYGLSGLASSDPEGSEQPTTAHNHCVTSSSSQNQSAGASGLHLLPEDSADTAEEEDEGEAVRSSGSVHERTDSAPLPVIEEERSGFGSNQNMLNRREAFGEGGHSPPSTRDTFGGNRSSPMNGYGEDRMLPAKREGFVSPTRDGRLNSSPTKREGFVSPTRRDRYSSPRDGDRITSPPDGGFGRHSREESRQQEKGPLRAVSGGNAGSMPSLSGGPEATRREGYEGHRKRGHTPPGQGSVADVEHKSVNSLLDKQQRQVGAGRRREQEPPPPLPPRTYSETELGRDGYGHDNRSRHSPPRHLHYHHRGPSLPGSNRVSPSHHGRRFGGRRDHSSPQLHDYPHSPPPESQSPPHPPPESQSPSHPPPGSQPSPHPSSGSNPSPRPLPGSHPLPHPPALSPHHRSSWQQYPNNYHTPSPRGSTHGSSPHHHYPPHYRRSSSEINDTPSPQHNNRPQSNQERDSSPYSNSQPSLSSNGPVQRSYHFRGEEPRSGHHRREEPRSRGEEPRSRREEPRSRREEPRSRREEPRSRGEEPRSRGEEPRSRGEEPRSRGEEPRSRGSSHHRGEEPQSGHHREEPRSNHHWSSHQLQRSPGRSLSQGMEMDRLSYDSYQEEMMVNGGSPVEYNLPRKKGPQYSSTPGSGGSRGGGSLAHSSMRVCKRNYNPGDAIATESLGWESHNHQQQQHHHREQQQQQGEPAYSPAAGGGGSKHFKYPGNPGPRNQQAWNRSHRNSNGTWEDDDTASHTSSSLPLHTQPEYPLCEEDEEVREEEDKGAKYSASRRRGSDQHENGRQVSRHKRLRHSTITSLTSLSDITGGMSRLGSIASLDYQASFAELSQADSVSGYIDPHLRSLVFEASLNSQGTEL